MNAGIYDHKGHLYLLVGLCRMHEGLMWALDGRSTEELVAYIPLRVEPEWAGTARIALRTPEDFEANFTWVGERLPVSAESFEHIRLICWEYKHVQTWSEAALRQIVIAPLCGAPMGVAPDDVICMSPIWAVDHEGEPRRYVGRPPQRNWSAWADCIPPRS